jgi:GDP-mannose 6-dehydrogenase
MQILVLGLGRLGVAISAALLSQGHIVTGVEPDSLIRDQLARGVSPFREPGVTELIEAGRISGRMRLASHIDAGDSAELLFVCVGTPGLADGSLDLSDVRDAARSIGDAIRRRAPNAPPLLAAFCSTMIPGSMRDIVLPTMEEAAGEPPGICYHVVYHPEFMREGSAIEDYLAPARIVIGEQQSGEARVLLDLYSAIDAPIFLTSYEAAELIKFVDNSFHALKVSFTNEIARLAMRLGISPTEIFKLFLADGKLNLSSSYLRPGGAFGGSCLPKDVLALDVLMRDAQIDAPIIGHIIGSNISHTDFLIAEIERRVSTGSRILLIGLSFKSGTDDVRSSPLVDLAAGLLARGHDLAVYDPDLNRDSESAIRSLSLLPSQLSSVVQPELSTATVWDLVVLGKSCPEIEQISECVDRFDINQL